MSQVALGFGPKRFPETLYIYSTTESGPARPPGNCDDSGVCGELNGNARYSHFFSRDELTRDCNLLSKWIGLRSRLFVCKPRLDGVYDLSINLRLSFK